MKFASLKKAFITASILIAAGHPNLAAAHSENNVAIGYTPSDPNAGASDLAIVFCDPGTDYLEAQVRDKSNPAPGLLVNLHLVNRNQMKTVADTVSGDAAYSPFIRVNGGPGLYYVAVTTTSPGPRLFDLIYHCKSNDGSHPESSIEILQIN